MNAHHTHLWPGVPLALASAALFGASTPLAKLLIGTIDPWLLAAIFYLGAGAGLAMFGIIGRLRDGPAQETPLRTTDLPWLAAVILFGGIMGPVLLMAGLANTSASTGSLLLNLEGLATMAIAWIVFRENVDRRLLLGAFAILAGAVTLSWQGTGLQLDTGGLMIALACLCWGIDNNLTRKLSSADPVQLAMIKGLVAGAVNLALALGLGAALPTPGLVALGALVGLGGIGLSLVLFIHALRHLGTARTGAYYSLAPFIGAVLAVLLLGEPATPQLLVAGLLMTIGLFLHLTERHAHSHVHEVMEHEHMHVHDAHHQHSHDGPVTEPHSHWHRHVRLVHSHAHYPDLHHRHDH
jgi:drug/metabolite transporter (DMT)-like permease